MVTRSSASASSLTASSSTDSSSTAAHPDVLNSPPNPDAAASDTPDGARERLTYVIDTSVLLSDPWALNRFEEHEVILPLVVIGELEAKRHHP